MNIALVILLIVAVLCLFLGLLARKGHDMNLEEWSVGGRSFGAALVFLLMAGEIYTTFTFLGGSGFAYKKGAPVYYILVYASLAYIISYFILPPIWQYAKNHKIVSQPHYFLHRYNNQFLGMLVALVGVLSLLPYLALQLKGLGSIVSVVSAGAITPAVAMSLGAFITTFYVVISGIRGSAYTAIFKDILILVVAVFLGIYLPFHYFGGLEDMFRQLDKVKPDFITFSSAPGSSIIWYQSTVLLTALGFFMWPQMFAATFTAKNKQVFKKNAIIFPLYQLILLFIFFVGFTAALVIPGLSGDKIDLALLQLSIQTFNPWVVGIIGAAGFLTAIVPGSVLLTISSTLIANDIYKPVTKHQASEKQVARCARYLVPVLAIITVIFTIYGGNTMVALLLLGYGFVIQLFPGVIFSLCRRNIVNDKGVIAGIVAGLLAVIFFTFSGINLKTLFPNGGSWNDFNIGLISVILNTVITLLVSRLTKKPA